MIARALALGNTIWGHLDELESLKIERDVIQ